MFMHTRSTQLPRLTRLLCALALLASGLLFAHPQTATAATFTVTKTSDSKDGTCNSDCSLREAIIAAHQQAGVDTITLQAGTYLLTLSDLDITSSVNIVGVGASTTIIESNGTDRIFEVRPDITVTIDKVTIRNGRLSTANGYTYQTGNGSGILNQGTLTLSNSIVSGNVSQGDGGGIFNSGTLTLSHTTVSGNQANNRGGGIFSSKGTLRITNSTVRSNSAEDRAGGIYNGGTLTISGSTISENTGFMGGGIDNAGTMSLSNSTVSDNVAAFGVAGGIFAVVGPLTISNSTISGNHAATDGGGVLAYNYIVTTITNSTISGNSAGFNAGGILFNGGSYDDTGRLTLQNVTITNNVADTVYPGNGLGGGIMNATFGMPGVITISNTIIAGNRGVDSEPECSGALNSQGYNLIQNTTGCTITGDTTGNVTGVSPQLAPLANNGGPTQTHALPFTSPAIDRGSPATPGSGGSTCAATDQRGQARPRDGNADGTARCDIGAVER